MSRIRRLATEGSWIVLGQIASVLGALVLVRVLTTRLDPSQYGQLALGLTVAGLVNQVVMGGISNGIGRFYAIAAEKQALRSYLNASRRLMLYATLVVMAIGAVLMAGLVGLGYSKWVGLAAASLVLSVLSGYNASLSAIQNGARQRAIVALHGAMDAWLKIFLALGVLLWLGNSSTAVVIGYALSTVFVTGSQLLFLRRLIPDSPSSDPTQTPWMQQMWAFSWPFSAWGLFTWTQQSSDRWALEAYASTHDVGRYSVLFQLGYAPISMATGLVMSFLGPILYQRAGDANDPARNTAVSQVAWRITFLSLLVTGIGFLLARGLHATVFKLLVSSQYQSVSYLLPWMVLAGGLFASGQMLSLKLMSAMKPAAMTIAKIVTALFGVLLNVYLASVAGLQGIVGAMVAFSLVYFAWMALLNLRAPLLQQAKG